MKTGDIYSSEDNIQSKTTNVVIYEIKIYIIIESDKSLIEIKSFFKSEHNT